MFKKLYFGELKKIFSLKTALIMLAIFILGFVVVSISFNALKGITDATPDIDFGEELGSNKINVSKADATALVDALEQQLEIAQQEKAKAGYKYYMSIFSPVNEIYYYKSQIAIYNYIIDNNLYNQDVYYYDETLYTVNNLIAQQATPFASTMLAMFTFLLSIYALIIGSGAYSTEMRNGTLKILLLSPITRNQLTLAKLLAVLTIIAAAFLTVFICIVTYSYIAYKDTASSMLFVFNAIGVFKAGYSFPLFLSAMSLFVKTAAYGIMAFCFGTLTRKRIFGFVIPYALDLGAQLVGLLGLSRFWITNVINFSAFFGTGIGLSAGSNFFISLPLAIAYIGGMIALSFTVVNKRDIV